MERTHATHKHKDRIRCFTIFSILADRGVKSGNVSYDGAMFRKTASASSIDISPRVHKLIVEGQQKYGAIACDEATPRSHATFVGEVLTTRIVPRGMSHWFEVVISDGTGKINGWFFGRKSIAGLELGSVVVMEGLVQFDEGEWTIANPYYEFL